jgi:hypothetical protein
LIPKGEKCGIKANMREKLIVKQGLGCKKSNTKHNTKFKNLGEPKGEDYELRGRSSSRLDDGNHPSKCKWFIFVNSCKFMFALIMLSSINKKGDCKKHGPIRP